MEQLTRDDPSYIARRLFKELCARFPDRYVALIEPPPLPPALAAAEPLAAATPTRS
jgi:hypothetical protein